MAVRGLTLGIILLCGVSAASADELVYQPVNPAFGGNPLNAGFLLSTAEGQRPERPDNRKTPLERFAETLQGRLLDKVAQKITEAIVGENAQDSGSFTVGDTKIDFQRDGNGQVEIKVTTTDGRQVTLEIPVDDFLAP